MKMYSSLNVYGNVLESCCDSPKTGFFRNGKCDSSSSDVGIHTVCILVTDVFLNFINHPLDPRYVASNDII